MPTLDSHAGHAPPPPHIQILKIGMPTGIPSIKSAKNSLNTLVAALRPCKTDFGCKPAAIFEKLYRIRSNYSATWTLEFFHIVLSGRKAYWNLQRMYWEDNFAPPPPPPPTFCMGDNLILRLPSSKTQRKHFCWVGNNFRLRRPEKTGRGETKFFIKIWSPPPPPPRPNFS